MRVLILGGTGAMGVHLVKLLTKSNVELFVTSRRYIISESEVNYIQGDAKNLDFVQNIFKNKWDVIIDFMVYSTPLFKERINLILKATSQYIFLSSARVYAKSETPITENSPLILDVSQDNEYLSTDEYALTKARQENILKNSGRNNWTIIRPYITYSENRLQLGVLEKEAWLYRALHGRTIVFSEEINSKITTLTFGLDIANAIKPLIGNSDVLGETFHITTNESKSWSKVLEIYLKVFNEKLGYKPNFILKNTDTFLKHSQAKYQVLYDRLYDRKFDNSKAAKYINIDSFIKIENGLISCLDEFLKHPKFKDINWKMEAVYDRLTKEHTPLMEISGIKQKIKYLLFRYLLKT